MGPSWYWMPDVFEQFFRSFGENISDYLQLKRLEPSYQVFFEDEPVNIPADYSALKAMFEKWETGASDKLDAFMAEAQKKYEISMSDLAYKPSLSVTEFIDLKVLKSFFSMDLFQSFEQHAKRFFKHPKILQLLEFPILFLGATAKDTPALYSLMNYADVKLGTWYPTGGMYKIGEAFAELAKKQGAKICLNTEAKEFLYSNGSVTGVLTNTETIHSDFVIAAGDYHHIEGLLVPKYRNYSQAYWQKRKMAPSSLLFYLGLDKKVTGLEHHNLFFDTDFGLHAHEIYKDPKWPTAPLFYVCCPSKTDDSAAPPGKENLFLLMPLAAGIHDTPELRESYLEIMLKRIEKRIGQSIKDDISYKRSYCVSDFEKDYHSFKGNAYGLANVLSQTAVLKPKIRNKKLKNLYYAGQLTVPGPGLPPAIISGQIVANLVVKRSK